MDRSAVAALLYAVMTGFAAISVPRLPRTAEARDVPVSHQNTFLELDANLLERIELTTEDIARNSTKEFVDHEVQAMIDLFANNLNINIDELQQYTKNRNSSDYDDARMKELQKKGLIMYENAAITREYLSYKISVITRSIEELEQLEEYVIEEEKRLKNISDSSLQKRIKSVLDKIQTTKRFIGKHVGHLRELDEILKGLGEKLKNTLNFSNHSKFYRYLTHV